MIEQYPRAIALCLVWNGNRILVQEYHDPEHPAPYYRPVGGGIEYGEHSLDAARREVLEELGVEVAELRLLATIENIYSINGRVGHQIAFVYEGEFVDRSLYEQAWLPGLEANGQAYRALWMTLEEFDMERVPLYPPGLLALLRG
jgi:8-oxo-dGTP pyrophosphatase MutT (NUDIX family)